MIHSDVDNTCLRQGCRIIHLLWFTFKRSDSNEFRPPLKRLIHGLFVFLMPTKTLGLPLLQLEKLNLNVKFLSSFFSLGVICWAGVSDSPPGTAFQCRTSAAIVTADRRWRGTWRRFILILLRLFLSWGLPFHVEHLKKVGGWGGRIKEVYIKLFFPLTT